jgi:hypothetical protein
VTPSPALRDRAAAYLDARDAFARARTFAPDRQLDACGARLAAAAAALKGPLAAAGGKMQLGPHFLYLDGLGRPSARLRRRKGRAAALRRPA